MFICVNGQLGSGKSTVCSLLKEKYGFEVFSTGSIQRQLAQKMNISTLELNKRSENDCTIDQYIDNAIVEFAEMHKGDLVVFDSRMAWNFVSQSFKVRLTIDPKKAAERIIINGRFSPEESYSSITEAMSSLAERQQSEVHRYKSIYNVDIEDSSNYDLIIDTSALSPKEVADRIMKEYYSFCEDNLN